jgi:hypothetical protein
MYKVDCWVIPVYIDWIFVPLLSPGSDQASEEEAWVARTQGWVVPFHLMEEVKLFSPKAHRGDLDAAI